MPALVLTDDPCLQLPPGQSLPADQFMTPPLEFYLPLDLDLDLINVDVPCPSTGISSIRQIQDTCGYHGKGNLSPTATTSNRIFDSVTANTALVQNLSVFERSQQEEVIINGLYDAASTSFGSSYRHLEMPHFVHVMDLISPLHLRASFAPAPMMPPTSASRGLLVGCQFEPTFYGVQQPPGLSLPSSNEPATPPPAYASPGSEELPSIGSARHSDRLCNPCSFSNVTICKQEFLCTFCHLCEPGERKRRKKERRKIARALSAQRIVR